MNGPKKIFRDKPKHIEDDEDDKKIKFFREILRGYLEKQGHVIDHIEYGYDFDTKGYNLDIYVKDKKSRVYVDEENLNDRGDLDELLKKTYDKFIKI